MNHKTTITVLIAGFSAIIILMVALGIGSKSISDSLADLTVKLYRHPLAVSNAVLEINAGIISMHRSMKDVVLARNEEDLGQAVHDVRKAEKAILERFDLIEERYLGDREDVLTTRQAFVEWAPIRQEVINLTRAGRYDEAAAITKGKGADHVQILAERMNGLIVFARNKATEFVESSQNKYQNSKIYLIGLILLPLLLGGCIAVFVILKVSVFQRHLVRSEETFAKIFQSSPAAISIADIDPGCIYDVNETWLSVMGYQRGDVLNKTVYQLQTWETPEARQTFLARLRETGSVRNCEAKLRRKDGTLIYVLMAGEIISLAGQQRILFVFTDITDRHRAEKEVERAKEQAELANRSKTEFLANMSHELRTPLTIINGGAGMMVEEFFGPLSNERYRSYARNIKRRG